ncbi:MAG: archease [Candidatus Helarchaeota archaeon]
MNVNFNLKEKLKKIEELPHTADVKYFITANNMSEAFELCGYCYGLTITDITQIKPIKKIEFKLTSEDTESLLYDFISELIYLFDTKNIIISQFSVIDVEKGENFNKLRVEGFGQEFDPNVHEIGTEVKAMTYSEMKINLTESDFSKPVSITIVFDI